MRTGRRDNDLRQKDRGGIDLRDLPQKRCFAPQRADERGLLCQNLGARRCMACIWSWAQGWCPFAGYDMPVQFPMGVLR